MRAHAMWLMGILAVAFALRAGAAVWMQQQLDHVWKRQFVIEGDSNGYWLLGERLAAGESFEIYSPPRMVLRMPGFPALLALSIRTLGQSKFAARLLLCVVGTLACGLVYALGRTLLGPRHGLLACAMAAVSPVMVAFSPLILSETLFACGLLASLLAAAHLCRAAAGQCGGAERGSRACVLLLAALTGVCIAGACYVRPSWLPAAAPLAGLVVFISRGRGIGWCAAGVLLLAVFLSLLPWGLRNQRVSGHFILTTLWMGPSLYDGLNPGANGDSDMRFFDRDNLMSRMSEYEVDRHYRREAWRFVRGSPGRAMELAAIKFVRFWKPWPNAEQFAAWPVRIAVATAFVPMVLFAMMGAWRQRRSAWVLVLAAGPILYFTALHMVFVSSLRYRLPAEYPLLVLTAAGLEAWLPRGGTAAGLEPQAPL